MLWGPVSLVTFETEQKDKKKQLLRRDLMMRIMQHILQMLL